MRQDETEDCQINQSKSSVQVGIYCDMGYMVNIVQIRYMYVVRMSEE